MGSSAATKEKLKNSPFKSAEEMKDYVKQIEMEVWTQNKRTQIHIDMLRTNPDFRSILEFYDDWSVVYRSEEDGADDQILQFNLTQTNRPQLIISKKLERIAGGPELVKAIISTTWPDYTTGVQRLFRLWKETESVENTDKKRPSLQNDI